MSKITIFHCIRLRLSYSGIRWMIIIIMYWYHRDVMILLNLFTTIHDGNFRRHSSMNVTIKWHKFSSNIYYIYVFFVIWSWKLRQQFQLQMTKNRTRTPVYLDPGMHPGLEVKGLKSNLIQGWTSRARVAALLGMIYTTLIFLIMWRPYWFIQPTFSLIMHINILYYTSHKSCVEIRPMPRLFPA